MPSAHQGEVKYAYLDHDTDAVNEIPPVQNTWYTVFDAEDVRLLVFLVYQVNDEAGAKTLEIKWTIDGNVYFLAFSCANLTPQYVFRLYEPSAGGTGGLVAASSQRQGAYYLDKRGHSFKTEVRMTAVPGTNQTLRVRAVRETLEQT